MKEERLLLTCLVGMTHDVLRTACGTTSWIPDYLNIAKMCQLEDVPFVGEDADFHVRYAAGSPGTRVVRCVSYLVRKWVWCQNAHSVTYKLYHSVAQ